MSLKVYDCYRPQRAVNSFVAWAKDIHDHKTQKEFYHHVNKTHLFIDGYIAEKSSHSRGRTVDLTTVLLPAPQLPDYQNGQVLKECFGSVKKRFQDNSLDFGTGFDYFDPLSQTAYSTITPLLINILTL